MHHRYRFAAIFGLGLLVGACTSPWPPPPPTGIAPADYVIGPGDALNVFIYRVPELSAEVPVRPDGRISTPLVPDIMALGRTPAQLGEAIRKELTKYVKDPIVTVMVTSFNGPLDQEVKVIGEVAQPLAVPYRAQMSLLDIMLQPKGLTKFAAGNRAVILRRGPDGVNTFAIHLDDLLNSGDISQNVTMRPGDTVFVPQAWF
jgi:polysaccharide export outer membrane protein